MHIGHGRTYVTADIYARYMRMKGYNVLFPFAFQFTGTPILSVADAIKRGDQDIIDFFKNVYEIDEEKIKDLSDPYKLAEYFKQEMEKTAKAIGLSVDWRRSFTTVDDRFAAFIQWQFKKLKDKGKLIKETDAVGYCPRDQFPVGMHDTKGDVEPEIEKLDVIFFEGDYFYPVATSRPETVFAGVEVAISPLTTYVIAEYSGKRILLSKEALEKLSYQKELKKIGEVKPEELKGKEAVNPVTRKKVKVVLSKLVDPSIGTGLIMLTPAHDPIHKIIAEDNGIEDYYSVISSPGLPEIPTEEIDVRDMAELKDFADQIYRTEYYKGVMKEVSAYVPDYMKQYVKEMISGKPVKDARI
ncbi:leucine--tRNA ligase, partial [Acidianus hospitalis]